MEVIVITNAHLIAFILGAIFGMILSSVTIWLMIPGMVKKSFKKLKD